MNTELKVTSKKLVSRLIWKGEERKAQKYIARVLEKNTHNIWWIVGFSRVDITVRGKEVTLRGEVEYTSARPRMSFPVERGPSGKVDRGFTRIAPSLSRAEDRQGG